MKFVLNKDKLLIQETEYLNSGSVNYYEIPVEYDESWNNLSKEAILIKEKESKGTSIAVINDKIFIDQDIKGAYSIGFVGYTIENNVKTYQISTRLKTLFFAKGAGEIEVTNAEDVPTPTEWEIYIAQIQEMLDEDTLVKDANYVHTDNNFTNGYKGNIDNNTIARHTHDNKVILDGITVNDISNWNNKQDAINDLSDIRSGASKGATAIQEEIDPTVPNHVKNITQTNIINWNNKAELSDIPDVSNFITKTVNDLTNYYLKSQTYTQAEVNNLIGAIQQFHYEIVQTLPTTGANNVLYLVPKTTSETQNVYDEYVYANNNWEKIGDTQIDLTGYAKETWVNTQINTALENYTTTENLTTLLNAKQNNITSSNKLSSDLVDDTNNTNKFVTSTEKTTWNNKSDFSGDYNDLSNKPTIPTVPTNVSAFTNDAGYLTNLTVLSYGNSTWDDFITAYNKNAIIYCKASSNSDPSTGNQLRRAFLAYVNSETAPTNVEFQYYRSISSHSSSQQGDQVFVYKLYNNNTWTVETRETCSKIIAGTNLSSTYNNGALTLNLNEYTYETNNGWTVKKYTNGYYEAWKKNTITISVSTRIGSVYSTDNQYNLTLPSISQSTIYTSINTGGNKNISAYLWTTTISSSNGFSYRLWSPTSISENTYNYCAYIFGTWKDIS